MAVALALAVVGCALIAAGIAVITVPGALIVAGVECIAAAYVVAYLRARTKP